MSDQTGALAHSSIGRRATVFRDRLALPHYLVEPAVLAVDFALLVCASIVAGIGYHWIFLNQVPDPGPYVAIGALAALNLTTTLMALSAYKLQSLISLKHQARKVMLVWVIVFLALLSVAFTLKIGEALSRGATLGFFVIGLVFLFLWRSTLERLLQKAVANGTFAKQRTMFIGDKALLSASQVMSELRCYGYMPSTVLEIDPAEDAGATAATGVQDKIDLAIRTAREQEIENVVLVFRWENSRCIEAMLVALSVLPIPVYLAPDATVTRYLSSLHSIGPVWTAELKRAPLNKIEQLLKRAVDLLGAGAGLLLLSPLMLTTALLIKLDSPGPIFFSQWRSGFNGRLFRIIKFRSMTVLEDGPVITQATRYDPRVTRVGRWLRRTNIDELPQLFNVLHGEMSLVGPRPHAAAHDSEYERKIADYAFRFQFKPGITGWAQSNGCRGETRTLDLMSKRVECDLWYINNWSVWLDLRILFRTLIAEVWRSHGY
jgi:undecaprenyl-phosphate galactose phosphotransferase/putative colanic acid biosynthesis UDP-glucose lipid carrier transferase